MLPAPNFAPRRRLHSGFAIVVVSATLTPLEAVPACSANSVPHLPHWLAQPRRAHLIGIAGTGMSSLATVLESAGWSISGSDLAAGPAAIHNGGVDSIQRLAGHAAEHVPVDADLVVHSSAIPATNPERAAARRLGIPELSYPEVLGRLQRGRMGLGVAGTHGKSTTTAMLTEILAAAGADPTAIFGAVPRGAHSGGRLGAGPHVLVEACEYQRNFLELACEAAIFLNVEWDHCETYRDADAVQAAFAQLARQLPRGGILVCNEDCPRARAAGRFTPARRVSFGTTLDAAWRAIPLGIRSGRFRARIVHRSQSLVEIALAVPGRHNLLNALAAAALAAELGTPATAIRQGLEAFPGLQRRCQTLGTFGGITLVDDYAHHPTELCATIAALRAQYPGRRICCVFQPHQAARTAALLDGFARSLHNADAVFVADIYRAREAAPPGITSAELVARIPPGPQDREAIPDFKHLIERLVGVCTPGDVVVACGAGDIGKVLHGLRERF